MITLPFCLGTTSYIYPADILTNVKRLAAQINDIQLLFYQVDKINVLPNKHTLKILREIADCNNITYTIHMPLGLNLGTSNSILRKKSLEKAERIMEYVQVLNPVSYTIHLNIDLSLQNTTNKEWHLWEKYCINSLEYLVNMYDNPKLITIENLLDYPIERLEGILEKVSIGLCLDVGHMWSFNIDPIPYFIKWKDLITVIHLHGFDKKRDHVSLKKIPGSKIHNLLNLITSQDYNGIITLELFSEEDFYASKKIIQEWVVSQFLKQSLKKG